MTRTLRFHVFAFAFAALATAMPAQAQITRDPTGVNVSSQDATTVFLTFGNLDGYVPDEALWCGELIPATPDVGNMCDPATIFGRLPLRLDLSRASGDQALTDIMSIPASVARRAYQAAEAGSESSFFYVRRFIDPTGAGPDQYVTVTCRLTGGGARVPLALLDVRIAFVTDTPLQSVAAGESPPPLSATIRYNGTGRLQGRWEVVTPGDEPPQRDDLLTEATLPDELRGTQRRYTELDRFNHFLPPTGEFTLPGPDVSRMPTDVPGPYLILLRIEASDDKEGDSSLDATGAGTGIVHSGAVAGFPLPPLRYYVAAPGSATPSFDARFRAVHPMAGVALPTREQVAFSWTPIAGATFYRLQIEAPDGGAVLSAVVEPPLTGYAAPSFLEERTAGGFRWRVLALGPDGGALARTEWRAARWSDGRDPNTTPSSGDES
jgi:hypothetical protein